MSQRVITGIFLLFFPVLLLAQNTAQFWKGKAEAISNYHSGQKAYLHLDKSSYFAGDDIWFKAYVVNAADHTPDTLESTLFVELINTAGSLAKREIIRIEKGYGHGDFSLGDSIREGNYLIRAYTPYMINFDESFIFQQHIFIQNPAEKNFISRRNIRENRRFNRELENKKQQYRVTLYPEGGGLVAGLKNRLGFHVVNELGQGVAVTGRLRDNAGNTLANVASSSLLPGRGMAEFVPEENQRYFLVIDLPNGRSEEVPVRNISEQGYTLSTDVGDESIIITVNGMVQERESSGNNIFLAIHTRGKVQDIFEPEHAFPVQYSYAALDFPAGISVATLFDAGGRVLAESLFFNPPRQKEEVIISIEEYRDNAMRVVLQHDFLHEPAPRELSVSITGTAVTGHDSYQWDMLSYMYLFSDLEALPELPEKVLAGDENNHFLANLLMLTSTWERYHWTDILAEDEPEVVFERKVGFPVFGSLEPTSQSKALELSSFEITLQVKEQEFFKSSGTDSEVNFVFQGLDINGEFEAELGVMGLRGSRAQSIELFPHVFSFEDFPLNFQIQPLPQSRGSNWKRGVSPVPRPSQRKLELRDELSYSYGSPDQVIYFRENDSRYRDMREVLRGRVSGVTVDGNNITFRGPSSILLSNNPYILIDGQEYSSGQFLALSPFNISHIEIFKGTSASIFGVRGSTGAIVGHSRRSAVPRQIILQYILSGYYLPRDFKLADVPDAFTRHTTVDYEQTLNWQPSLRFDENGLYQIVLPVNDNHAEIRVSVEGVSTEGKVISNSARLIRE